MENDIKFPPEVVEIAKILDKHGKKAYAVGGCVRDSLMGREPNDWDMTTDASPEEMLSIFGEAGLHTIPTGLKHGTVTVMIDKKPYECTTFRIDGDYIDSRRPDKVTFTKNLADDLCRRDFTVNAMAADPLSVGDAVVDLYGGRNDIENKIIRCVGNSELRFTEDALRIIRAVRFASVLGFEIDRETAAAAEKLGSRLEFISAERKSVELEKILLSSGADRGIRLLCELGLAKHVHEKIKLPKHKIASLPHSLPCRLASLFLGESDLSLSSMKLSNSLAQGTKTLADNELYNKCATFFGEDGAANARYLLAKYGALAECAAILRSDVAFAKIIADEREKCPCVSISQLDLNGHDLISLGIEQKKLSAIFDRLLIETIKAPEINKKEPLLAMAQKLARDI